MSKQKKSISIQQDSSLYQTSTQIVDYIYELSIQTREQKMQDDQRKRIIQSQIKKNRQQPNTSIPSFTYDDSQQQSNRSNISNQSFKYTNSQQQSNTSNISNQSFKNADSQQQSNLLNILSQSLICANSDYWQNLIQKRQQKNTSNQTRMTKQHKTQQTMNNLSIQQKNEDVKKNQSEQFLKAINQIYSNNQQSQLKLQSQQVQQNIEILQQTQNTRNKQALFDCQQDGIFSDTGESSTSQIFNQYLFYQEDLENVIPQLQKIYKKNKNVRQSILKNIRRNQYYTILTQRNAKRFKSRLNNINCSQETHFLKVRDQHIDFKQFLKCKFQKVQMMKYRLSLSQLAKQFLQNINNILPKLKLVRWANIEDQKLEIIFSNINQLMNIQALEFEGNKYIEYDITADNLSNLQKIVQLKFFGINFTLNKQSEIALKQFKLKNPHISVKYKPS